MNNIVNKTIQEKLAFHQAQVPPRVPGERFNDEQRLAIYASGENILVSANAGAGKTAVLTERIIQKVIRGTHLKEMIVLTFTKDAATEMKERVRKKLIENLNIHPEFQSELDSLDNVHIETIDAFCLSIVKQYHYLLNISDDIKVGDEMYLQMMKEKIMRKIFDESYDDPRFVNLIKTFCTKDDEALKNNILGIFNKVNENPDTIDFLNNYINKYFSEEQYELIKKSYMDMINKIIKDGLEYFYCFDSLKDPIAVEYAKKVTQAVEPLRNKKEYFEINHFLEGFSFDRKPTRVKSEELEFVCNVRDKFKELIKKLAIYLKPVSLDELIDNYKNTKDNVEEIVEILKQFSKAYQDFLDENKMYDFSDITKLVIRLFKEHPEVLEQIKASTKGICVDEYQDVSLIQDNLICSLSNDNLFFVGDLKQSIYRFRHANPENFKNRYDKYSKGIEGFAIDLAKNFRSRKEVLDDINLIFNPIMTPNYGGVTYHPKHELQYGLDDYDKKAPNPNYHTDVITFNEEETNELDINRNELEIKLVIKDILDKINNKYQVYDKESKELRPIELKDFVILVQNRTYYEIYKKVFEEYGLPLVTDESEDFLNSEEIYFLIHVLRLAWCMEDPNFAKANYKPSLVGFLRSFVFDYDDVRISSLLLENHSFENDFPVEYEKIKSIRQLIKTSHLSEVIKAVYKLFDLTTRINKLNNIKDRIDKLNFLYQQSLAFESTNITILEFLEYIEYLRKNDSDFEFMSATKGSTTDAIHILTIHKSKGLEYPYCYFINNGAKFKFKDADGAFVYNEKYGICISQEADGLIESNLKILVKNECRSEEISEKIRLLYVALTRAREHMTIITPEVKDDASHNEVNDGIRSSYDTFDSIYKSIFDYLTQFETKADLSNFTESTIAKSKEPIQTGTINYRFVNVEVEDCEVKESLIASHQVTGLIDEQTKENIELGNYYHELLEVIPIKQFDEYCHNIGLEQKDINILSKFYHSDFINNLNIINEYHEYPFVYDNLNGIIDLLIETENEFIVIDYKTYHIDKDYYEKQVKTYIEFISSKTNKKVSGYLYSIVKGIFKKVE